MHLSFPPPPCRTVCTGCGPASTSAGGTACTHSRVGRTAGGLCRSGSKKSRPPVVFIEVTGTAEQPTRKVQLPEGACPKKLRKRFLEQTDATRADQCAADGTGLVPVSSCSGRGHC